MGTGWRTARGIISLERPVIAGILNITPDSFSDGGRYLDPGAALRQAESVIAQGADLLDLGAESTRPGRPDPVPEQEEWGRLEPVLREVLRLFPDIPVSIDTVKSGTARRALGLGAWAINDVSGLRPIRKSRRPARKRVPGLFSCTPAARSRTWPRTITRPIT